MMKGSGVVGVLEKSPGGESWVMVHVQVSSCLLAAEIDERK